MKRLLKWAVRAVLAVIALIVLAVIGGWTSERWSEARDARNFPPPGKMVDVGDGRRHILCEGQGAPTVVLVTGGGIASALIRPLQDQVMQFTRVCAYDRAGLGWSEPAIRPMNALGHAAELWTTLLTTFGETGPFVLVGHSYAGLIVRQLAKAQPQVVVGMVLVNAAEEGVVFQPNFLQTIPLSVKKDRNVAMVSKVGVLRVLSAINPASLGLTKALVADRQAISFLVRPRYYQGAADEAGNADASIPAEMQMPGGFGGLDALPLVVIQHGQPFTGTEMVLEAGWADGQSRLAALSSDSQLIVARNDGHNILMDNPDFAAAAVHVVVDAVQRHQPIDRAVLEAASAR